MTKMENSANLSAMIGGALWSLCGRDVQSKFGLYWSEQGNIHGSGSLGHNVG
jgi:hypothetical protein